MAFTYGITGLISGWGTGTDFNNRLVTSYNSPVSCTISVMADTEDARRFVTTGAVPPDSVTGLRSWSGSFKAYLATPRIGNTGLLTYGTYGPFARSYDLSISAPVADTTVLAAGVEWRSYTAGPILWNGSAECFVDDTTALPAPAPDAGATAITMQVGSAKSLTGSAHLTSVSWDTDPSNIQKAKLNFLGKGYLAVAGAGAELFAVDPGGGVYTITTPLFKTLTVVSGGTTYSGLAAPTTINLKVAVDSMIEVTVNFQGSGALSGVTGS
jgi:hypothetical protein